MPFMISFVGPANAAACADCAASKAGGVAFIVFCTSRWKPLAITAIVWPAGRKRLALPEKYCPQYCPLLSA
jgi:hypothetical protein